MDLLHLKQARLNYKLLKKRKTGPALKSWTPASRGSPPFPQAQPFCSALLHHMWDDVSPHGSRFSIMRQLLTQPDCAGFSGISWVHLPRVVVLAIQSPTQKNAILTEISKSFFLKHQKLLIPHHSMNSRWSWCPRLMRHNRANGDHKLQS